MPDLKKEYEKFELAGEDTVSENITSGSYMLARKILAQGGLIKKQKRRKRNLLNAKQKGKKNHLQVIKIAIQLQ